MSQYTKDQENDYLKDFLRNAIKNHNFTELECELRAGLGLPGWGGTKNELNYADFRNINEFYDSYKSEPLDEISVEKKRTKNTLDIFVSLTNHNVDLNNSVNNLRYTLKGKDVITQYCSNGKLPTPRDYDLIYKGAFDWDNEIPGVRDKRCKVDFDSIRTRLAGKVELKYNTSEKIFKSSLPKNESSILDNLKTEATDALRRVNFMKAYKNFRLKERTTYKITYKDMVLWVDLTRVRQSKNRYVQNFVDSGIKEDNEKYEYEIEFSPYVESMNPEKIQEYVDMRYNDLTYIIDEIYIKSLVKIGNFTEYTPYHIQSDILEIYNSLIDKMLLERVKQKRISIGKIQKYIDMKNRYESLNDNEKQEYTQIDSVTSSNPFSFMSIVKNKSKSDLDTLDKKYLDLINNPHKIKSNRYISPKVVSIDMDNVREENQYSICHDYTVTDKADGLNMLLFKVGLNHIDADQREKYEQYLNRLYLIDANMIVYDTNLKVESNGSYLFNGEYMLKDYYGKILDKYGIFDCYISSADNTDEDICSLPLMTSTGRSRIKIAEDYFKNNVVDSKYTKFSIFVKNFYPADEKDNIFSKSKIIWDNYTSGGLNEKINRRYKLDGMIYTPALLPVGYRTENLIGGANDYDLKQDLTWRFNLKWKPPVDNSIDLLIRFEKEEIASYNGNTIYKDKTVRLEHTNLSGEKTYPEYKIANLYCGDRKIINDNPCRTSVKTKKGPYKPTLFKPTHPPEDDIHRIYIPIQFSPVTSKNECLDKEGDIIDDDTIVEVTYSDFDKNIYGDTYKSNPNLRWTILRTRHDKTYQYRNGIDRQKRLFKDLKKALKLSENDIKLNHKEEQFLNNQIRTVSNIPEIKSFTQTQTYPNGLSVFKKFNLMIRERIPDHSFIEVPNIKFGNDFNIANNIWTTIHNPITAVMITTGNNIPDVDVEEEKYYNRNHSLERNKSVTIQVQNLHNKVIKNKVLLKNVCDAIKSSGEKEISLLDLACGKGGDIPKWRDNEISVCVGIDVIGNNILDPIDGACERYNHYKKNPRIDKKLPEAYFLKGDVSKNINNGEAFADQRFKDLFGELWNISNLGTNFSQKKFDIISVMFAIHYFFGSKDSLDTLIDNIDNNLKKGGYLIGTSFDGKRVHDLMKTNPHNEYKQYKSGELIWKIKKNYYKSEFPEDVDSIGLGIDVLIYSIGKNIPEFLVNYNYLIKRLEERNIRLLSKETMENMDLPQDSSNKKLSVGSFESVYNKLKSQKQIDNQIYKDIINQLSEEEKKFSFLFNYFIFRKDSESDTKQIEVYEYIRKNKKIFQPILKLKSIWLNKSRTTLKSAFDGYSDEILEWAVIKAKTETDNGVFKYEESSKKVSASKLIIVEKASVEDKSVKTKEPSVVEDESGVKISVPKKKTLKIVPKKETTSRLTLQSAYKTWKNTIDKDDLSQAKKIELSEKILARFDNDQNRADAKKKLMLTEIRLYLDQNEK